MTPALHHQQQQLAALLAAALPKDDSSKITAGSSAAAAAAASPSSEENESSRLSAITSLHRAILYPPNALLVSHSASYLAQGLSQLVTDKLRSVRHAAATAYAALCSVLCSLSKASNGRQNPAMLGSLVDGFIAWSLPSLSNITDGTSELALESLNEFLDVGEIGSVERYALPILKVCQELLEDERMPLSLMPRILRVLTLISLKFFRSFQPHFKDIVDLLLGWALVPDSMESDKHVIMDSFLQFQKHWVNNLQFSLGLLSKFLDDMDMLLQDGSAGSPPQFKRLLALLSCFCTVLQSVASGLLEINFLEKISEPLMEMVPVILRCLSMIGRKFGWSKWMEQSWRCLTLLAEILSERFSTFYPVVIDILFQSLEVNKNQVPTDKISSTQVCGVLRTNLQLLSLQKLGLMPSSVDKILQFDKPISQLRLHPSHVVTGSAVATYIFVLQHRKNDVVERAIKSLFEELQMLKFMLGKNSGEGNELELMTTSNTLSKSELVALISFNTKVLLSSVDLGRDGHWTTQVNDDALYVSRAEMVANFLTENFNPFISPIKSSIKLQVTLLKLLEKLSIIDFMSKCPVRKQNSGISPEASSGIYMEEKDLRNLYPAIVVSHLRRYTQFIIRALDISSPLAVKFEALEWMHKFCQYVIDLYENVKAPFYPCQAVTCSKIIQDLLFSILMAASDREPEVRALVATVLPMLFKAKLIHPMHFPHIAQTILEKLGDPETDIKNAYLKLLSDVLPLSVYVCGLFDCGAVCTCQPQLIALANTSSLHWKMFFALKQLPQRLHSQQLVSILSYISQRWKVPLSSWIQRLILTCRSNTRSPSTQLDEAETFDASGLWWDIKVDEDILERSCSANHLAGSWWAVHEAARFCMTTRLRTNLGGPTQTFAALERMLLDISHVLQLETEQKDGALNLIGSYAHLLPMRLLLEFVEALRKNVYNAYEGSIILPHASRTSSLFFRANKKVCEEWFARITEPMMDTGLALQCNHATIQYCALRLLEIRNIVASAPSEKSTVQSHENLQNFGRYRGDILRSLWNLALALCKNHESETLVGLQKWAMMVFSPLLASENQGPTDDKNWGHFSLITGLAYQARGQYEKAAAYFVNLLQSEESLASMSSGGIQFAIARIIECYTAISDWKSLESWLLELQALRAKYVGKSFSGALTTAGNEINSIQALASFDEGDFQAARSYLDLTPKSSNELTLDPRLALQRSEQMLLQAMLLRAEGKVEKVSHELQKAQLMLEEALSVLPLDGLVEVAPHINQLYCISAFEGACKLGDGLTESQSLLSMYIQTIQFPCNLDHQDCNMWLKVLRICQNTIPTSPVTLEFCKNLVILARKQRNLMLATRLNNYLKGHASLCSDESLRDYFISSSEYENALILHVENKTEATFKSLWSFVRPFMVSCSTIAFNLQENALKSKACLKLSNWLLEDSKRENLDSIILEMQEDFMGGENSSPGKEAIITLDGNQGSDSRLTLIIEELVGTARKASTLLCPMMGKSWILYASWCYTQATASKFACGKTPLHCSSPIIVPEIHAERFTLNEKEKLHVKDIVMRLILGTYDNRESREKSGNSDISVSECAYGGNKLKPLWQPIIDAIETAAGAPSREECSSNNLLTKLLSEFKKCLASANSTIGEAELASSVADLVDVYWSLRRRRLSLFGQAAQAFINYLSNSSLKRFDDQLTGCHGDSTFKNVNYTLKSTLYVLHILVNYGVELKDTLEPALLKAPLLPWQEITPQLFAQLSSHPEKLVRKQLETLLVMLAKLSPWSLIYPTLVDANSPEKEPSEELQKILAYLNGLYPRLVQDAQLMIKELENVTVLWEELWLGTLLDLHADVMRRINLLKEEAARIAENTTLTQGEKNKINAAKYTAMMAPIVVVLQRRWISTSRTPETPHELWFLEEYKEKIELAITKFKTPPPSVTALGDVWRQFESIAISLASYQRKPSVSLGEVSPQLASLLSSSAPMPGLEKQMVVSESEGASDSLHQQSVTIASFSEQVAILPTKTKPKKIVIVGSDGLRYTYLLKGREDLRLDARIMQLLQSVNGFMQSSSATRKQPLAIRSYSVTPISGRAGLIQWVDNSISIYSVFKSWQKRTQLQQLSALGHDTSNAVPPVARPSDMFYGKIIPALKEKGIRKVISRRDWPHDVKRKVLLDLMNETPKQLLYQELWCASEGFKGLSLKLKRFSGSVAAMSMVGHILGLGDRHLDNILVDFFSGDIVHIDYNVCFDKGQRLKIPEIVPFRLTQTIEAAIGLTGIEGSFRANCEAVLGALRKNKDIVLMLLEVFVWDPLVEWTRPNFHDDAAVVGEERKGMELAVSLSLFASRAQEIRVSLQEHHDLLLTTLPAVESAMERFVSILNQYEIVSSHFCRADQERSNFIQYETSARSVVAEATCNSEQSGALFDIQVREFSQAQAIVMEKAREAVTWIDQHGRILDALRSSSIPEIKSLIEQTGSEEALSLTSAVIGAGVPWTIVPEPTQLQCHDIDREVSHSVAELAHGLASAVAAMQIYSLAMQRILPLNYITTSPVHAWAQILLSLKNLSSEVISIARRNATELVNNGHIDRIGSPRSNYDDLCFKLTNYSADILRMEEECSALEMSIGVETESEAKEHLVSAFMNYMQHTGLKRQEESIGLGPTIHERTMNNEIQMDFEEKQEHFPTILGTAVSNLFSDVKIRTKKRLDHFGQQRSSISSQSALEAFFIEFEEQIEKCVIVTNFLAEQKQLAGLNIYDTEADANNSNCMASWASIFRTNIQVCKNLIGNVADVIVPTLIKSVISFNSDVMDIFGSISQIRGLVDTALEQLIQVELERDYLVELESNYFVNVDLITEQQLALEEEAVKGRDLLSWEEAEELASQEETCRVQLDRLHQTWNQKDLQTSSLEKTETDINDSLVEAESQLQSLIASEPEAESLMKRQVLLAALFNQFSNLELLDETLGSSLGPSPAWSKRIIDTIDSKNSGCSLSEYIWDFPGLQNSRAFFIWKVFLVDLLLESCLRDVAASFDQNLGHDQLADFLKKKLKNQFQEHIFRYLKNRVAPIFLTILDRKIEILMGRTESNKDPATDQIEMDYGAVRRIQLMLEEYCNVHETFKAARSAASIMKRQVDELKDAFSKTSLHIAQIEWMQNITSRPLEITRLITHKFLPNEDHLLPVILNTNRPKLLEGMRSSISKISRSLECLKSCEGSSAAAEGQLERALGWACGDPNPTFPGNVQAKSSGIPPQFHDHLIKRRNLLQEVRKNASDVMEICISISEFEASRDGIIRGIGDSGTWHQSYQSAITKLDVAYHSFARAEKEWRLAQSNMEVASNGLVTATNELSMASTKAKSASVNLQSTLLAMRDSAYEASVALSSYGGIVRGHTALTSECGSMLEEVLAITEGLHDVHNLGKEAALIHASLMEDLLKANAVLIPLESLLSKDVAAMTDAMTREKEIKSEIALIHGQAIFQSYYSRLNEALRIFKPMVPSLTSHVQGLFSLLTRLARAASLHAGNLHKALEGVGENLQGRSEEIDPLGADLTVSSAEYDTQKSEMLMNSHGEKDGDSFSLSEMPLPDSEWISPPFSLSSGSTVSYSAESAEASIQDALGVLDETLQTSGCSSSQDVEDDRHELPSTMTQVLESPFLGADYEIKQESCSIHPVQNDEEPLLNKEEDDEGLPRASFTNIEPGSKVGKNAYAISVLRRVEMKLDGRDITDNREISVAEQVDFLLRQATDINNLCSMYEGWTPWI